MDRAVIAPSYHPPTPVVSVSEMVVHARPENLCRTERDDPLQSYEIR